MRVTTAALAAVAAVCLSPASALDNGVALTPPMGWLSWERFRCNTGETGFPREARQRQRGQEISSKGQEGQRGAGAPARDGARARWRLATTRPRHGSPSARACASPGRAQPQVRPPIHACWEKVAATGHVFARGQRAPAIPVVLVAVALLTDCTNDPENCISEQLYMDMADQMVADGYRDVGYEYVNIDDCWPAKERVNGKQVPDPVRFPRGIKFLADYMHSRGLKLGLYSDAGTETCGGYPGIEGHEKVDLETFASWEIDSLKLDGCYFNNRTDDPAYYGMVSGLLNATERPILFSCSYPAYLQGNTFINYTYAAEICNGWRLYDDIQDNWGSVEGIINFWGQHQEELAPAAGPGHQNDPDMILVGDTALATPAAARTQLAIWSILSAPLLMSNDLRNMTHWQKEILLNTGVIAVNQDPLVKQGTRVALSVGEAWFKPLANGDVAVGLRNPSTSDTVLITAPLHLVGIPKGYATAVDLWNNSAVGTVRAAVTATVGPYDTAMFRLTPQT